MFYPWGAFPSRDPSIPATVAFETEYFLMGMLIGAERQRLRSLEKEQLVEECFGALREAGRLDGYSERVIRQDAEPLWRFALDLLPQSSPVDWRHLEPACGPVVRVLGLGRWEEVKEQVLQQVEAAEREAPAEPEQAPLADSVGNITPAGDATVGEALRGELERC